MFILRTNSKIGDGMVNEKTKGSKTMIFLLFSLRRKDKKEHRNDITLFL